MKQNTTFPNLIQKFITDDDVAMLTELIGYEDTARKLDSRQADRIPRHRSGVRMEGLPPLRRCRNFRGFGGCRYHSTISKKMKELDYRLMKKAFALVVDRCNRATRRALKIPNRLLLVDSTTITVGKNRLSWALYHGERSGIKLHVSFTSETGMPLAVIETGGLVHDGPVGEGLADPRFILVQDRTYFNIKRIDRFVSDKQDFVIRMKENIELSAVRSLQRLPEEGSNVTRDVTCWLGHRILFPLDQTKPKYAEAIRPNAECRL